VRLLLGAEPTGDGMLGFDLDGGGLPDEPMPAIYVDAALHPEIDARIRFFDACASLGLSTDDPETDQ